MNRKSQLRELVPLLFLILLSGIAVAQTLDEGRTNSGSYRILVGESGLIGAQANSSSFNVTITSAPQPVGRGNTTTYNVSLGYVHTLDKNFSPPTFTLGINDSLTDIKINDVLNISANITGSDSFAFAWFTDNMTGSDREHRFTISGKDIEISQNLTNILSRNNTVNITAYANDTVGVVYQSSLIFNVNNTLPTRVPLVAPNSSEVTFNRTPTFFWNFSTDADGDALFYEVNIICIGCSSDNRFTNTTTLNHTPSELLFLGDDNFFYNWSVQAYDNYSDTIAAGPISKGRNITVNSLVSLTIPTDSVDFGALDLGARNNTTNNLPPPFVIQNNGNVNANVTLHANTSLWQQQPLPSDYFQFKIDNITGEEGAFNTTLSNTTFDDVPAVAGQIVADLDYHDNQDEAEVDILVEVPTDEPAGSKVSKLVFEASLA